MNTMDITLVTLHSCTPSRQSSSGGWTGFCLNALPASNYIKPQKHLAEMLAGTLGDLQTVKPCTPVLECHRNYTHLRLKDSKLRDQSGPEWLGPQVIRREFGEVMEGDPLPT